MLIPKQSPTQKEAVKGPIQNKEFVKKLKFGEDTAFQTELRRRVDAFMRETGRHPHANTQMYLKTFIILAGFAGTYILLVFFAHTLWQGLALSIVLGLWVAGIGFNIQHDGGHNAYSSRPWINKMMAMTLDLIGGSSYFWRYKHALIHHPYVNIAGYDTDIELGWFGRLAPHQKWRPFHKWQHIYLWPLYGLLAIKWQLVDDFVNYLSGRVRQHRIPRPKGLNLATFLLGKAVFFTWAFFIPLQFHPFEPVAFFYVMGALVLGLLLSLVFQLPHTVEGNDFPLPDKGTGSIKNPWAVHQAQVTFDFARHERIPTWALGGLNYHLEHHLFPIICHVHYPAFSKVVEATCREFKVRYREHRSFGTGVVAHYRWLKKMGSMPASTTG